MKLTFQHVVALNLGLGLALGGLSTTVYSATNARVLSTATVSPKIYHGNQGTIYRNLQLTKPHYRMKNYSHTNWRGTKRARIRKDSRTISLTYITSGTKKGWVYTKQLIPGKAPKSNSRAAKLFSVKNPQKFLAAYRKFTGSGHGIFQRGSEPIGKNYVRMAGLTPTEYRHLLWGIQDYYQNASNHHWATKQQIAKAERAAFNAMAKGKYAKHPIKKWEAKYAKVGV